MDFRTQMHSCPHECRADIHWPRSNAVERAELRSEPRCEPFEAKLNMYERQIDQLFEFTYKEQDDIERLFKLNDGTRKQLDVIDKKLNNTQINELKTCINNYYYLEIENKKRMEAHECYQLQLFIVQILIIIYIICVRMSYI